MSSHTAIIPHFSANRSLKFIISCSYILLTLSHCERKYKNSLQPSQCHSWREEIIQQSFFPLLWSHPYKASNHSILAIFTEQTSRLHGCTLNSSRYLTLPFEYRLFEISGNAFKKSVLQETQFLLTSTYLIILVSYLLCSARDLIYGC